MDQLQTVFGFFTNTAEAQQAVQLLLAKGFTEDTVAVSTQPYPDVTPGKLLTETTEADQRSGRFLVSLFGDRPIQAEPGNMLVMVQAQSVAEARQVADLLEQAGSGAVTVQDGKMP